MHVESTKKAQVRACAINNITRRIYHETKKKNKSYFTVQKGMDFLENTKTEAA